MAFPPRLQQQLLALRIQARQSHRGSKQGGLSQSWRTQLRSEASLRASTLGCVAGPAAAVSDGRLPPQQAPPFICVCGPTSTGLGAVPAALPRHFRLLRPGVAPGPLLSSPPGATPDSRSSNALPAGAEPLCQSGRPTLQRGGRRRGGGGCRRVPPGPFCWSKASDRALAPRGDAAAQHLAALTQQRARSAAANCVDGLQACAAPRRSSPGAQGRLAPRPGQIQALKTPTRSGRSGRGGGSRVLCHCFARCRSTRPCRSSSSS